MMLLSAVQVPSINHTSQGKSWSLICENFIVQILNTSSSNLKPRELIEFMRVMTTRIYDIHLYCLFLFADIALGFMWKVLVNITLYMYVVYQSYRYLTFSNEYDENDLIAKVNLLVTSHEYQVSYLHRGN